MAECLGQLLGGSRPTHKSYAQEDSAITWGSAMDVKSRADSTSSSSSGSSGSSSDEYLSWGQLSNGIKAVKHQFDLPNAAVINMDIGVNPYVYSTPYIISLLLSFSPQMHACVSHAFSLAIGVTR